MIQTDAVKEAKNGYLNIEIMPFRWNILMNMSMNLIRINNNQFM